MTADAIEDLIKEIAAKNGIAVGRDDPILVLHTLNAHLLRESARAHQEALSRFREDLELMTHSWDKETKAKAERILNAALSAAKQAMASGVEENAQAVAHAMRKEIESARAVLEKTVLETHRSTKISAMAAAVAVVGSGIALWACISSS